MADAAVAQSDPFHIFTFTPLLVPLVAGLVTVISGRIGIVGRIRSLEMWEKRVEIISALLEKPELTEDQKAQLRIQLRATTSKILESGEADGGLDAGIWDQRQTGFQMPDKSWSSYPAWRRNLILPLPPTAMGWALLVIYYYFALTVVFQAYQAIWSWFWFGFSKFEMRMILGGFALAIAAGLRLLVRMLYRNYYRDEVKSRFFFHQAHLSSD